ncbi:helix-turn-helix domain-containing protein [Solihabitans fulvus]|uniref:Helix-turn-helix domain-containing protein n=1 Tax=Solihabitans fulvus TaxID=1892852 RepID=A0A5B2WSH2_9PSEU|nr:helix-turn-helix transcriptional regulator [Solihabitans fulvus]KAA2253329.1 helix-turn-helix domain-containing protein [Solihabitans fulvus]
MSGQSPSDYKIRLGEKLTELREAAGFSRLDAAHALECSESKVGKIERGAVGMLPAELDRLLNFYGVEGEDRADLLQLGDEARRRRPKTPWGSAIPDRLRKYFPTEETATLIRAYQPELVHGLAQTEDYARAIILANPLHSPRDAERLVQARMARQTRLMAAEPPRLDLVLSEAAIRRAVGGADVMRAQLMRLKSLQAVPNITLRVIPFAAGAHAATGFSFTLFTPPDRPVIAYVENLTDGLFVSDAQRVENYELIFDALGTCTLSPQDTLALVDTVAEQL